jgi:photosystem II stability/assembly factor-like uncharacterized protein
MLLSAFYRLLFYLLLTTIFITCSTGTDFSKQWQLEGLKNVEVNHITKAAESSLLLATDTGVFVYKDNHFYQAGLEGKEVVDIVLINPGEMIAGTGDYLSGPPTLFKTTDGGNSWHPYMGNYGGEKKDIIVSVLAIHPEDKNMLFARGWANVSRSKDGGQTWKSVYGSWDSIGGAGFLKIDPNYPNVIWAGGASAAGTTHLVKSTDKGNNWKYIRVFGLTEAGVGDVVVHRSNPNKVLAGLASGFKDGSIIRKSIDGGQSWQTVLEEVGVSTFARSARNSEIIYATGRNADLTLFFVITNDFGKVWKWVNMENSPTDIRVFDMVSLLENGKEVLFFGTNKGIYTYTFEN